MAKRAQMMSLADLERMMELKKSQLNGLVKRRDKLQQDLTKVEAAIAALQGHRRAPQPAKKKRTVRRRRRKGQPALRDVVKDVLAKNKGGLSLSDLAEKVLASGYKSSSKKFKGVLYQCVFHNKDIQRDKDKGVYRLKS